MSKVPADGGGLLLMSRAGIVHSRTHPSRAAFILAAVFSVLLVHVAASGSEVNDLPAGVMWHKDWISLRSGKSDGGPRRAVLHNRGRDLIMVSMIDGGTTATLLCKTPDGWRSAGPMYFCGVGMWKKPLAPGDSLEFTFSPSQLSSRPTGIVREYCVILPVRHGEKGPRATAVSSESFRFP